VVRKIFKTLFLLSLTFFVLSLFQKDKLPGRGEILPSLYQDPLQEETAEAPFEREVGGTTYTITPLYHYQLYGLVVSTHESRSWTDYYHQKWTDFINVKDFCVVWGENVKNEVYLDMRFTSNELYCQYQWPDRETGEKFSKSQLSNNHLLSDRGEINERLGKARKGDQIYLEGYLAEYAHSEGAFRRGSSTTREDTGRGACETIFLTDFRVLETANDFWRIGNRLAGYFIAGYVALSVILFFISPFRKRDNLA
jgi:hypothetical protein